MTPTMTPTCRCGIPFDNRGTCQHCDSVRICPADCAHCRWRDHHCPVCGIRCPTIPARINHENKCREKEEIRERKSL